MCTGKKSFSSRGVNRRPSADHWPRGWRGFQGKGTSGKKSVASSGSNRRICRRSVSNVSSPAIGRPRLLMRGLVPRRSPSPCHLRVQDTAPLERFGLFEACGHSGWCPRPRPLTRRSEGLPDADRHEGTRIDVAGLDEGDGTGCRPPGVDGSLDDELVPNIQLGETANRSACTRRRS